MFTGKRLSAEKDIRPAKRILPVWSSQEVLALATFSTEEQDAADFLKAILEMTDAEDFFETRDYVDLSKMLWEREYNPFTKLFDIDSEKQWPHEFITTVHPQVDMLQMACLFGNEHFVKNVLSCAMTKFPELFCRDMTICIPESFCRPPFPQDEEARTFQGSYLSSLLYMVAICYEIFENALLYEAIKAEEQDEDSDSDLSCQHDGNIEVALKGLAVYLIQRGAKIDELPPMFREVMSQLTYQREVDEFELELDRAEMHS